MLRSAGIPLVLLALAAVPVPTAFAGDPVNSFKPDASAAAVKSLIRELRTADTVELRLLSPLRAYVITIASLEPAEVFLTGVSSMHYRISRTDSKRGRAVRI
jgi:hypothetical protein